MTIQFKNSFFGAAVALAATALTFGLSAGPALASPSVMVTVTAADLATAEGRTAVDARIARAAAKACGFDTNERDLGQRRLGHRCVADSVANAQATLAARQSSRIELAAR